VRDRDVQPTTAYHTHTSHRLTPYPLHPRRARAVRGHVAHADKLAQAPPRSRGSPRSRHDDRGTLPVRHCHHYHKRHPHLVNHSPVHTLVWQSDFYATDAGRQHFADRKRHASNTTPRQFPKSDAHALTVVRRAQVHPLLRPGDLQLRRPLRRALTRLEPPVP